MAEYIAQKVQTFLFTDTGHAYDILAISAPPQHGKSACLSESLPSWYLGKRPGANIILASYDSEFAERFCRKNKDKIRRCGKTLFGLEITGVDRTTEFEASNGGRMISRGIMSGITGNPADLILIDDPVKNQQEADSPTYRSRVWAEWQASLKSRLAAKGKVILIMTRWHEEDLLAQMLQSEPSVQTIRLPVEAEENDPLGRAPGDALCPELGKDNRWLQDFKTSYRADPLGGQRAWAALYQCSPRVEEGNLIRRSWWKEYNPAEITTFGTELISVDAAFKGDAGSDFVSIQVWGRREQNYYLRYCLNQKLNFPETIAALRTVHRLFPRARTVLMEEAANGPAIIQTLQNEMFLLPVTPLGGKVARVHAVSPAIEAGHVFLPPAAEAPWVPEFIDQFSLFPNGRHDDMVDACSQALNRLIFCSGEIPSSAPPPPEALNVPRLFDPYQIGGNAE